MYARGRRFREEEWRSGHVSSRHTVSSFAITLAGTRRRGSEHAATISPLSLSVSLSRREPEAHRSADQLPEPRSNICPRKNKSPLSLTTGRASLVSKRALFNRRRITDPERERERARSIQGPVPPMSRFSSLLPLVSLYALSAERRSIPPLRPPRAISFFLSLSFSPFDL